MVSIVGTCLLQAELLLWKSIDLQRKQKFTTEYEVFQGQSTFHLYLYLHNSPCNGKNLIGRKNHITEILKFNFGGPNVVTIVLEDTKWTFKISSFKKSGIQFVSRKIERQVFCVSILKMLVLYERSLQYFRNCKRWTVIWNEFRMYTRSQYESRFKVLG